MLHMEDNIQPQKYALSLAPKIGKTEFDFSTIDPGNLFRLTS